MKKIIILISAIFFALIIYNIKGVHMLPKAEKRDYSYEIHGLTIEDKYHWLRDSKWPKDISDKKIIDYLKQENKYADAYFDKFVNERKILLNELKGRIDPEDKSVPINRGDYEYYVRFEADKDYPIYCRKKIKNLSPQENAQEEIIIDQNELAKDKALFVIGSYSVSHDNKFLAYSFDEVGNERFKIKILDLETKTYLPDEISDVSGSIVWDEARKGFFYTALDDNNRRTKVYFHKLGQRLHLDQMIYHETNDLYGLSLVKSASRRCIYIDSSGHGSNQVFYIKSGNYPEPKIIKERQDGIFYSVEDDGENFYLSINDAGPNFRVIKSEIKDELFWQEFIPYEQDKYLSFLNITEKYLILNYKSNALPLIKIIDLKNGSGREINFPDQLYTANAYSTNFFEDDIRIEYSSLVRPDLTYKYDYEKNNLEILKSKKIPSGFNPDSYRAERVFVEHDNVKVPVSIVYKKDLFMNNGSNPLYLYGYGSYGYSIPVSFRSNIISLLDRGVVYVIAHVRGGDDMGFSWYEQSKFTNKKVTFSDFIAVADFLVDKKYTSKGNIIIAGGSAGGMLVGAVANERPDLLKGVVAHVPFVDVLNTMLDETLPLTPGEFKEWGNPKEIEIFNYMRSYSPYDNVKAQNYPAMFVTAGLSDIRVGYWEAAKWVAKLREMKIDDNIILLKTNMDFGHSGSSGRFSKLDEIVDEYIFVLSMFYQENPDFIKIGQ